ncbi:MAG: glycosyltransferase family 4 protein, partial [Smithella sp.]
DIFPQWALDAGVLKKGLLYNYFKGYESVNYNAADIIGVESPGNEAYFSSSPLDKKYSVEVLYNWAQISDVQLPSTSFRRNLKLENKVVFFYGGNIGLAQDMDNIIRLAARMGNDQKAFFLIVGDGSEVNRLNALIKQKHLTNILIHAPVSQEQYQSMLDEFDVGLVSLDCHLKTYNFPGKMLGYMEHGLPVLASINEGNNLINSVCENEIGFVSINGNDEALAANARQLMGNEKLRRRLGSNGRTFLENNFSVSRAAEQILSHFPAG